MERYFEIIDDFELRNFKMFLVFFPNFFKLLLANYSEYLFEY